MKVCVIQPPYSIRFEDRFACFEKFTELMDAIEEGREDAPKSYDEFVSKLKM